MLFFLKIRSKFNSISITFLIFFLNGCACISAPSDIKSIQFSVYHPASVVFYRPISGSPPLDEHNYIYLALQNDSKADTPICFACWNNEENIWDWIPFHDVVPVVSVISTDAPIIGKPEIFITGLGGQSISPLGRYPDVLPDTGDFPLNEANYRRDVAIKIRPDRSITSKSGILKVSVSLAKVNKLTGEVSSTQTGQATQFNIPISFSSEFRPETSIPATSSLEIK